MNLMLVPGLSGLGGTVENILHLMGEHLKVSVQGHLEKGLEEGQPEVSSDEGSAGV